MVGNTYPYTRADWRRGAFRSDANRTLQSIINTSNPDITLAASKGIDGFALNIGSDPWQLARVADAYAAAIGTTFALFPSFDMGNLPCARERDGDILRTMINTYYDHSNQMYFHGAPLVSTFGGQQCHFGQPTINEGWRRILKTDLPAVHFIASFFMDPAIYGSIDSANGAFSWDSAWPMGNYDIDASYDNEYRRYLNGRTYMAGVSPWFFTHYGPDSYNKNFIFRADNWLLAERWEILIRDRELLDIVQIITWNDFGESHYMGPIDGAQPKSESWTTGFDHQGWLDLQHYYITAYKTGRYPEIERDRIFLWGRLYPAAASSPDPLDRPQNFNYTEDFVWGVVLLTEEARLDLSCGDSRLSIDLPSGHSKVNLPLTGDCSVTSSLTRGGSQVLRFAPQGYNFSTSPPMYNFNAFVAASP
ncbi:alpha-1,3-glucanase [Ephemerocybe angulata]|uniref:Alpha-1,3-glucanase n=1 Tax=Ephemerocybe angulata TaxID=980116 RepID=A0A8H6M5C7_9AGAR|nr:alpha-1,3-glucanase [Tulosesus angulatus]